MREQLSVWAIIIFLLSTTLASTSAPNSPAAASPALPAHGSAVPESRSPDNFTLNVYGIAPDGTAAGGEALSWVVSNVLRANKLRARQRPPPPPCANRPAPTQPCVNEAIKSLQPSRDPDKTGHVALLPVSATGVPEARDLSDVGLLDLGDAAAPWRRACVASAPPARSLLDLADPRIAALYHLPFDDTASRFGCVAENCTYTPEWCAGECAVIFTSYPTEKDVLADVVREHRLFAKITPVGARLVQLAKNLSGRPVVVCDRALELSPLADMKATRLGPPPCVGDSDRCPFEPVRLKLYANNMTLARYPSALWHLENLFFGTKDLYKLTTEALRIGPENAARAFFEAHPLEKPFVQLRVAVLYPNRTPRQAYEARSLITAAKLVETEHAKRMRLADFKVELFDDSCSASNAYKYLTRAQTQGDYGSLSAVAGPACGAAFADVARQASADHVPVLAYTPQAPPPPPAGELALLAAGDARDHTRAFLALAASLNWRRLALLREPATRAGLDLAELQSYEVTVSDLPEDTSTVHTDYIKKWASRMAEANMRVLYVSLEDAQEVRAALCAGHTAALTPAAGAVWLLPSTLPAGWLAGPPARGDCAPDALAAMAEGHLTVAPAWLAEWAPANDTAWGRRCSGCTPFAAALYDALHLWATAVEQHLDATQDPVPDDWHRKSLVRNLIHNVTSKVTTGITGTVRWASANGVHARVVPLVVRQWRNGSYADVGRWENGTLALDGRALRWATADGGAPGDGSAACGLQALADALGGDCRAAFVTLCAALLAALAGALAALALHCRRRAEREYRAHVELLRLRAGGLKPASLDRWEVPRERVVINRKLGTGAFGTVYGGYALLAEDRGWTAVAVKTLKAGATTEEKLDFLSEAEAMKRFDHKNIVRLLAVVTKTEPVCTVMEFMLYGDLKNYLLARRHLAGSADALTGDEDAFDEVSPRRLTGMALDAARALAYLAQLRYVHRDVAARNCLVSASRALKLADFGMTRLVFEKDYYRFGRKGMLPVRWMAPESLALGVFAPASDVWSFGVLLYEIVTFGSLPFQGFSNSEVLARVKAGRTLDLPPGMKPQLEGLIKSCWRRKYKTRPAAAEVAAFLADSPRLLTPCLDVPLDVMPLDVDQACDHAEARWVSWGAPASASTETTYLSADAPQPHETDAFLS